MAETNEYELQALWWKRVLSAFTKRHDRQEIPYVLELLRCVGDQRGAGKGERNKQLFSAACKLKDYGVSPEMNRELLTEIWCPKCDPPYDDEQEIERSVHSAYDNGQKRPGCMSADAEFEDITQYPEIKEWLERQKARAGGGGQKPAEPGTKSNGATASYIARRASDIKPEKTDWLWKHKFPRGELGLLCGRPGQGKSTFTCAMVAAVTTGGKWPDGTLAGPPKSVVIVNAEDDPATTVVPRLIAAGADLSRVHFLEGVWETEKNKPREKRRFDLTRIPELIKLMQDVGDVALVIVDPIMHYMGGKTDSHKDSEVRASLDALMAAAKQGRAAIIMVTHDSKTGGRGDPLDAAIGSRAFVGLPRAYWLIIADPEDATKERRVFSYGKVSNAPQTPGIGFKAVSAIVAGDIETSRLEFEAEPERRTAHELLDRDSGGAMKEAVDHVRKFLSTAPRRSSDLEASAAEAGISERTLNRARKKLKIVAIQRADGWYVGLPGAPTDPADEFDGLSKTVMQ